ncbi:MAG: cupin domain-containing protein [Alphaproteobacteria bacterium]|nr:cupin domain-containing protein [Alphaproteobacteria bacterium]
MAVSAFVVRPEERVRGLAVVGEKITVLAPGSRTQGYEIFLQQGDAGQGPPPHSHDWDESFYVVSGDVAFGIGDQEMVATPGTLVHLPAGTTHWFRFENKAEMISMTSREGASAFFTEVDEKVPPGVPDLPTLGAVAARHGVKIG